MKIGDLVKNGQGQTGIVIGIGYMASCPSYEKSPFLNPDVHVIASTGKELWSYKTLVVISESR